MMILVLMRTAKGKEDPEIPLLQRISSSELTASAFMELLRIAAKKPLLKDTNKKKRIA
jgi:hypothetical protein